MVQQDERKRDWQYCYGEKIIMAERINKDEFVRRVAKRMKANETTAQGLGRCRA